MIPPAFGYDRAITIFSPDGRLFQVEYAMEAVKKGATAVGVKCKDGVVLSVEKKLLPLQEPMNVTKVFQIDEHVGVAIAGLTADARILIHYARLEAQLNRLNYDEPISVELLAKRIGDIKQLYTQHAGVRPFGVSLLIAGVDDKGPRLFMTDPSGTFWEFKAVAMGAGAQAAMELLEKEYRDDLSLDDAVMLALKALRKAMNGEIDSKKVEMAIAYRETRKFRLLSPEEVNHYVEKLKDSKG
ncbi:MAG: archaeal proteasome endopeptidase complex subunit alpha [Candidatus Baldrarchaeia archaeon]